MRLCFSLMLLLIIVPSVAAQNNENSASSLVLGMGFIVLLLLLGLMIRVLRIKEPAEPIPVSLPPKKLIQEKAAEERVYGELIVMEGLSGKNRILVTKEVFAIGRGLDNNDFELNLPGISRQHIVLRLDATDNRMYITDLASANGTVINGTPLKPNEARALYNGDEIALSHVILRWRFLYGADTEERPAMQNPEARRTRALNLTDKEKPEESW